MSLRRPQPAHSAPPGSTTPPFRRCQVLHETFRQQKWSWMPSRSCRPRGQPVRVCAASSDAPAQGDARRAPLHAQALRRRESAAAIQARRYAPEKKQTCEVRAYGNAAVAAAAATEATCALDIVVTRRCRAHLCVPRGNPEARGGLCQCHRGKPGWGSWGSPGPSFTQSTPLTSPTCKAKKAVGRACNLKEA